jgi:hypothetical protein
MAQTEEILGNFLPTTQIWSAQDIQNMKTEGPEFKEFLVKLYQDLNNHATSINDKDMGVYDTQEYVCGKSYFNAPTTGGASNQPTTPYLRPVYRKVINWNKALPNGATDTVAYGIANIKTITAIYGASTDPTHKVYIPLPFISCKLGTIALWATSADVVIDCCGFDGTDYTTTYVVLEYLKD